MEGLKRCANFSKTEENLLLDLVKKYKNKIENKKTDVESSQSKKEAWLQLEKEFNISALGSYRAALILKRKYENIKKRVKAKFADEEKYLYGTGGGPSKLSQITITDEKIKDIIGDQMTGRDSFYDGDAALETETQKEINNKNVLDDFVIMEPVLNTEPEVKSIIDNEKNVSHNHDDWSFYTPSKLRTPKSAPLKKQNINKMDSCSLNKKLSSWAQNKVENENIKKNQTIEEQKVHLEFLKDSYKLNLEEQKDRIMHAKHRHELFVEESKLRMEIMREEHSNKLEFLGRRKNS